MSMANTRAMTLLDGLYMICGARTLTICTIQNWLKRFAIRYYKSTEKGRAEMSEWEKKFHNEGIVEERLRAIKSIMESLNVTAQRAMEILKIPAEEQQKYATLIR